MMELPNKTKQEKTAQERLCNRSKDNT